MLTLETFSEDNRTKIVGHSMYRIATDRYTGPDSLWYIYECYNDVKGTGEWARSRSCFTTDLQKVIDIFNSITAEKEILDGTWKEKSTMLDLHSVPWRIDRAADQFFRDNAAALTEPEKMPVSLLSTAMTYCATWENPYAEEAVRRVGMLDLYHTLTDHFERVKFIQYAFERLGCKLI